MQERKVGEYLALCEIACENVRAKSKRSGACERCSSRLIFAPLQDWALMISSYYDLHTGRPLNKQTTRHYLAFPDGAATMLLYVRYSLSAAQLTDM